jgi:Oxoglutarate and iron-dependent oxygenase degradation C-term
MQHVILTFILILFVSYSYCCVCTLSVRFVKYVSAAAPGSRWDVAMEYEIDIQDDEDEEEEEGDEEDEGENGEDEE